MKTLFLYLFVFLSILHNRNIIEQNQKTLDFFMNQLLPSLFILCVFVQLIPTMNIKTKRKLKLLNIDFTTLFLIFKMILLGNPANSYMINQLLKEKQISLKQAIRLISCISIPSISFMLMTLPYLYNHSLSIKIFIIHLITIFLLLLFTRNTPISIRIQTKEVSLIQALLFSIKTMALILSYLFVVTTIQSILLIYFPQLKMMIYLLSEFSSGTYSFIHEQNPMFYLLICIGFGGFCTHLQVISGCDEVKMNYVSYFLFRILHVFIHLFLFYLLYY